MELANLPFTVNPFPKFDRYSFGVGKSREFLGNVGVIVAPLNLAQTHQPIRHQSDYINRAVAACGSLGEDTALPPQFFADGIFFRST